MEDTHTEGEANPAPVQQSKSNILWWSRGYWKQDMVDDLSAPAFYSRRALYGFSVFFSTLFGAILLSMNIRRSGDHGGANIVLGFGLAYIVLSIIIGTYIPGNSSSSAIVFGVIGGTILNEYFWKKYLKDTKYRARSVWPPLLIGIGIFTAIFVLIILPAL